MEQCSGDKFKGVDILLTSEWPKGADNFTKPPVCTKILCMIVTEDTMEPDYEPIINGGDREVTVQV